MKTLHGIVIKGVRMLRGFTQAQLAEMVGVDSGSYSRWERGIRLPDPGAFSDVYDHLNLRGTTRARVSLLLVDGWKANRKLDSLKNIDLMVKSLEAVGHDGDEAIERFLDTITNMFDEEFSE